MTLWSRSLDWTYNFFMFLLLNELTKKFSKVGERIGKISESIPVRLSKMLPSLWRQLNRLTFAVVWSCFLLLCSLTLTSVESELQVRHCLADCRPKLQGAAESSRRTGHSYGRGRTKQVIQSRMQSTTIVANDLVKIDTEFDGNSWQ